MKLSLTTLSTLCVLLLLAGLLGPALDAHAGGCHPCTYILFNGRQCDNSKNSAEVCASLPGGCDNDPDEYCESKYGPGSGNIQPEEKSRLFFDPSAQTWTVAVSAGPDQGVASAKSSGLADPSAKRCKPVEPYVIY